MNADHLVFGVVLAAGRGARFGATKQLAEIGGQPLVRRACELARQVCGDNTVLVTGHDSLEVLRAAGDKVGFVVVNDRHEEGIGTSIAMAARSLAHTARGMLLLLADQPLITRAHLCALLDGWSGGDNDIAVTSYADTMGPPVLFPRGAFADLMALCGRRGASHVLRDRRFAVKPVRFEDASVDIDTPDDLENVLAGAPPPHIGQPE